MRKWLFFLLAGYLWRKVAARGAGAAPRRGVSRR